MYEPDTSLWRKEHGVHQKPQAIVLYATLPLIFAKLQAVLDLYQLPYLEPLPNTALVSAETELLTRVIEQWRGTLDGDQLAQVRACLLEMRSPSREDVERGLLNLADIDEVLGVMRTRWLIRLLAADGLFVVFQPIVSLTKKQVVAYECLARAQTSEGSFGADQLVATAKMMEKTDELDYAIWRAAFRQGRSLAEQGHSLCLNFTPSSILDPKFGVLQTKALCMGSGVDFSRLVFEVSMAQMNSEFDHLKAIMRAYRAEGARVALDDLGSGYASMITLADLRPDIIKLDRYLMRGAHSELGRTVLARSLTAAARELGILVAAEGVETAEDLRFCLELGADLAQGYFIGCPAQEPPTVSQEATRGLEGWSPP